jgi:hypothetical protein
MPRRRNQFASRNRQRAPKCRHLSKAELTGRILCMAHPRSVASCENGDCFDHASEIARPTAPCPARPWRLPPTFASVASSSLRAFQSAQRGKALSLPRMSSARAVSKARRKGRYSAHGSPPCAVDPRRRGEPGTLGVPVNSAGADHGRFHVTIVPPGAPAAVLERPTAGQLGPSFIPHSPVRRGRFAGKWRTGRVRVR